MLVLIDEQVDLVLEVLDLLLQLEDEVSPFASSPFLSETVLLVLALLLPEVLLLELIPGSA